MRVVLVEDSVLLREGLVRLFGEFNHEVVAGVGDADRLIDIYEEFQPDLVVVDVRLPPTHTDEGLRAAVALRTQYPTAGVLVLSQYVEEIYAAQLLEHNPQKIGYLLKDRVADVKEFVEKCEQVASGGTVMDPQVVAQMLLRSRRSTTLGALTARESDVLGLMAEGRSNSGIAQALSVSAGAVEKHVSSIFLKLVLPPAADDHRRVLAVLTYLRSPS